MTGSEAALIGTGVGLGVVHVLTGPDHLSALATLSAVSDLWTSFWLGVRWGLGHSTGLLLVGIVLIIRDYSQQETGSERDSDAIDMPDSLSHFFESIVGVFMLCLGVYGLHRALRLRHEYNGHTSIPPIDDTRHQGTPTTEERPAPGKTGSSYHDDPHERQNSQIETLENLVFDDEAPYASNLEVEEGISNESSVLNSLSDVSRRISVRSLAVLAGIIHGLAGPGGVLGVIPAVQLHDWKLASIYLASFCLSSTLTMGCFASSYGLISSKIGEKAHVEFQIHCFSSVLSILVGLTWLILLAMGKLEDVFP